MTPRVSDTQRWVKRWFPTDTVEVYPDEEGSSAGALVVVSRLFEGLSLERRETMLRNMVPEPMPDLSVSAWTPDEIKQGVR